MIDAIVHALGMAFAMGWEILWPLILGFLLSGVVQAVVSHREMGRLLPDDRPRSIATALALLVFLRRRGARPLGRSQRRGLHRGHGIPIGVHQPRRRTEHYHADPVGLAVDAG